MFRSVIRSVFGSVIRSVFGQTNRRTMSNFSTLEDFSTDHDIACIEIGNEGIRAASTAFAIKPAIAKMLHRYVEVDGSEYANEVERCERAEQETYHMIEWRKRYFILGEAAQAFGTRVQQRQNLQKWERDYLGMFMLSMLLHLYEGNPPSEITIYAAHPPFLYRETDKLLEALLGNWKFNTPSSNKQITVNVIYGEPCDEITGSIMHNSLNADGIAYDQGTFPILGKGPTIAVDLGGGTFDIVHLKRDGSVDYNKPLVSVPVGGTRSVENFRVSVSRKHSKLIGDGEDGTGLLTRGQVFDILHNPEHTFEYAGKEYPCTIEFKSAFNPLITTCKNGFLREVPNFVGINAGLTTGGIYGLLQSDMDKELFQPLIDSERLYPAEKDPAEMFLANIRGLYKLAKSRLLDLGAAPKPKKRGKQ